MSETTDTELRLTEAERETLRGLGQGQYVAAAERIIVDRTKLAEAEVARLREQVRGHEAMKWPEEAHRLKQRGDRLAAEREKLLQGIEALAQRGVGTDLTPTVNPATHDVSWWYGYLCRHDDTWRNRLRSLLQEGE